MLDAVVTDRRRGVERLGDLPVVDQRLAGGGSALHRIVNPRPGVAVGLQLEGDTHQPLGLSTGLLDGGVLAREVLYVVAELVGDDVGGGQIPRRSEVGLQLIHEVEVDVHEGVDRAVERPGRRRRRAAFGVRAAGEQHQVGVRVGLAERLGVLPLPVVLNVLVGSTHDLFGLALARFVAGALLGLFLGLFGDEKVGAVPAAQQPRQQG